MSSCCSSKNSTCQTQSPRTETRKTRASLKRHDWMVQGMDCPSCAAKVENALKGMSGVYSSRVAFATERLIVEIDPAICSVTTIKDKVSSLGFTLRSSQEAEQDTKPFWQTHWHLISLTVLMIFAGITLQIQPSVGQIVFSVATLFGLIPFVKKSIELVKNGTWFGIETLMSVAAIGALLLGETVEAAMVLLLFSFGELLEGYAAGRARQGVKQLMALTPDTALLVSNGVRQEVMASTLQPGDIIEVRSGDRLPIDGELLTDNVSFDESALTGESVPVVRHLGEKVMAGCMAADKVAQVKVTSEPGDNAIDRILRLIEEAEERRAPIERFIDSFSRVYTPIMFGLALLVMVTPPLLFGGEWIEWIYKGLTLLLIACPCALVISTPAAVTSALAAATRAGVLIKGGAALEQLGRISQIAFDKTGTLTQGKPEVTHVIAAEGSAADVLSLAASVEQGSSHPLAQAILAQAETRNCPALVADNIHVYSGIGVAGEINGLKVEVISPKAAKEKAAHLLPSIQELEDQGNTVVVVLKENIPQGIIALGDTLRHDAEATVAALGQQQITSIMLTGDNKRAASTIASKVGADFRAELLPADKVSAIETLKQKGEIAMVGDGINDAPAFKAAGVGIAMGQGTDVALETADAVLTHERLSTIPGVIRLARATRANIRQNITLALGLKVVFLITTMFGFTGLWAAVLADSGGTALVTLNALRLLGKKPDA
ncbi:zinc/cadmium/mercury/lead-transporting ATPase [Endozoicomonadaceae bacterium StTr2]